MGATRRTQSKTQFFQIKHYCLWREIKSEAAGCDSVEVTNPKTGAKSIKYGYAYDELVGRCVKLIWYDTKDTYDTRYFGFKLTMQDQGERFVLDLPYKSIGLRRLMMAAPNIDWAEPLSIRAFKGKNQKTGADETAIWIQQNGQSVKQYYTKDHPNGLPEAHYYAASNEWDFKAQLSWLAQQFRDVIGPKIDAAGAELQQSTTNAVEDAINGMPDEPVFGPARIGEPPPHGPITDDDVPF